ncbi:hypothetical protein O0L34_g4114 [Tuta absoluta]|nr:hypothetical protein O0L34_g4114 [Tuta absoluta]
MENSNVRWAFNAKTWEPSKDEIIAASSFIQTEEKERISRFVFKEDAKSSLIGRLMMRKFVHISSSMPYEEIRFGRDDKGKPILLGAGDSIVNFNVSHQGDYVVLAGSTKSVGIDVMKVEPPPNKNIPEYFRIMNRQFSTSEWRTIRSYHTEMEQIACFYRLWCLKESYVKNIGIGITIPLVEISFAIKTLKLEMGKMVNDTTLYIKDVLQDDWLFEETLLDEKHTVAVSLQDNRKKYIPLQYTFLTFDELVNEAKPLVEPDEKFGVDFLKKQMKHF